MSVEQIYDPGNLKFRALLKMFNKLIENSPEVESVKENLLQIKEMAKISGELTFRQVDAIVGRCENYLNGTYGKGKENVEFKGA